MPKSRPPTSGYARIAQEEEQAAGVSLDDSDEEDAYDRPLILSASASAPRYAPIQSQPRSGHHPPDLDHLIGSQRPDGRRRRVRRSSSGVDIKAINARLERWAEEIASKFKIGKVKGKSEEDEHLEIHHSVFQAPDGVRPATAETLGSNELEVSRQRMTKVEFDDIVESVRVAIEVGIHPKLISQGSSGSYFARTSDQKIVGVFKPKDEEPYASRNPKWTKWIHRNLFPCCFGRACLIPNLSYISEAAAHVLDSRLRTDLVPYTDIVYLSSKSFHYDFWDRRNYYRKRKPLPPKIGSFQVFLKGFKDANIFLKEHPWPDQHNTSFRTDSAPKRRSRPWNDPCKPRGASSDDEESELDSEVSNTNSPGERFFWTDALQQSFREELEKLVVLDYIMRNTDRGLDNWMIKVDWDSQSVSLVSEPPKMQNVEEEAMGPRPVQRDSERRGEPDRSHPYRLQQPMEATSRSTTPVNGGKQATISLGAIDNSLSWPWKHPDAWRSFPFGWLFLPVSLIGQPFSQRTRDHFLPLLTSTKWWSDTQVALRRVFSQDSDFKERMFARQIAVMKGQAWNVVETLKTKDHGPLELTRRARVCVWDDLVDVPVAVPLRVASSEMRRRQDADLQKSVAEEMDIGAVKSSSPPQVDILGLDHPSTTLPNPNRFSLSRNANTTSVLPRPPDDDDLQSPTSPVSDGDLSFGNQRQAPNLGPAAKANGPPHTTRTLPFNRSSYDGPSRRREGHSRSRRRRYSFTGRHGNGNLMYSGDDLEGDLGYAAAEDMEMNRRKVIVERLETVKGKNPVFSWC
ncbi:MAG: phosphatidyl inositol kinase [Piccolia ochrophora]|nr:MAG: phosphatidyl inositol kinase [Piccolia ochrophora]